MTGQEPSSANQPFQAFVTVDALSIRWECIVAVDALPSATFPSWKQRSSLTESERSALATDIQARLSQTFLSQTKLSTHRASSGPTPVPLPEANLSARWVRLDPALGYVPIEGDPMLSDPPPLLGISVSAEQTDVDSLQIHWSWFPEAQKSVTIELSAEAFQASRIATPQKRDVSFTSLPTLSLTPLSQPTRVSYQKKFLSKAQIVLLVLSLTSLLVGFADFVKRRMQRGIMLIVVGVAFGSTFRFLNADDIAIAPVQIDDTIYANLRNVYRAFEFREPPAIYDALAEAAEGDLLEKLFLEFESSLTAASSGGPRVRILDLDLRKASIIEMKGARLAVSAEWITVGTVTHWGHEHTRSNRYRAVLDYVPSSGVWKLGDFALEEEQRLFQKATRRKVTGNEGIQE